MSEYKYNEYDRYENGELVHESYSINDTKYDTYKNFDSYMLFYIVCTIFGSYFCHIFYICTKNKYKIHYDYYKKNKKLKQKLIKDDNDICSICLEKLKDNKCVVLSCEHIYHKVCIQKWLKKNDSCPICRINII